MIKYISTENFSLATMEDGKLHLTDRINAVGIVLDDNKFRELQILLNEGLGVMERNRKSAPIKTMPTTHVQDLLRQHQERR